MTLRLSTDVPTLDFELDGAPLSLPVELTLEEMRALGAVSGDGDGLAAAEWFRDFAAAHAGEAVRSLSADSLTRLMESWGEARAANGEPGAGEP